MEVGITLDLGGGDDYRDESTSSPGSSTSWQHIIMVRSGTTGTCYVDNVSVISDAAGSGMNGVDVAGSWYFGMRSDSNADRRLNGQMAEWAKWSYAAGTGMRAALAKGYAPSFFPNLDWYLPMIRSPVEVVGAIAVTDQGMAPFPHPPIIYPNSQILQFPPAAAGGPSEILSTIRGRPYAFG